MINSKLLKTKLMMIHQKIPQIQLTAIFIAATTAKVGQKNPTSPSIKTNLKRNIYTIQRRQKKNANTMNANIAKKFSNS